jgi:hypothetical protein
MRSIEAEPFCTSLLRYTEFVIQAANVHAGCYDANVPSVQI